MSPLPTLTQRPTPSEYGVLAIGLSVVFILLGVIGFTIARRAPAEKHEAAVQLMRYSAWSLGSGVFVAFAFWLYRKLTQ
jgi:uncharacterized membrane protein YkvI